MHYLEQLLFKDFSVFEGHLFSLRQIPQFFPVVRYCDNLGAEVDKNGPDCVDLAQLGYDFDFINLITFLADS